MKILILIYLLLLPFVCVAQKVIKDGNTICIEGNRILYFDALGNSITRQAHRDSLETDKYIISIKGTDEIPEIHLVYKHPKLDLLLGKTLPEVNFHDISGEIVKLGEYELTVVCFWNIHCSVCVRELIALNILAEEYPNVGFVALSPDSCDEVIKFMNRLKLDWENVTIVPNYNDEYVKILRIFVYPSNVILDKDMIIKGVNIGGDTRKLLRTLEQLCDEK